MPGYSRAAAAALEVVAADEVGVLVGDVAEPRDVRRDRTAVVQRRFSTDAGRHVSAPANPHDVLAQIAAEHAGRIPEAGRVRARSRVEQDARGVEGTSAEDDHWRFEVHHLARVRIDDPDASGAVRRLADEHFGDPRVRAHGQVAAVARRIDERRRRVERRVDVAPASAPPAPGAARPVFVVQDALGRDAGAAGDVVPSHLGNRAFERHLDAIQLRRPLKHAVGDLHQPFVRPGTSEQHVNLVVVRLHIVVARSASPRRSRRGWRR